MKQEDAPDLNELALRELGEGDPEDDAPAGHEIHTPTAAQSDSASGESFTPQARAAMERKREASLRPTLAAISLLVLVVATVFGVRLLGIGDDKMGLPEGHPDISQMTGPGVESEEIPAASADPNTVARLEAVIEENPEDIGSMRSLADLYYAVNDYENSAAWQQRILDVDPQNLDALMMLGLASFNGGDMATAKDAWGQALAADPGNVEALFNIGFVHLAEGRYDEAQSCWEQVEQATPGTDLAKQARDSITRLAELTGEEGN